MTLIFHWFLQSELRFNTARSKKNMNRGTHGSQRSRIRHYQAKLDVQKCAWNFHIPLIVWVMVRPSDGGGWPILRYVYGRVPLELPSRHVLSPDSILNLFLLLRPDFESFLLWANNDILSKSDFERNIIFFMSKSTKKVAGDSHTAGENNGQFFKFKVVGKLYQINTNNFHNHDHAWKWSRGSVSAPPWGYFCRFWLRCVRDITIIWP